MRAFLFGLCALLAGTGLSQAHEIRPALMEFQLSDTAPDQLDFTLDMTAEIFLSGLDAGRLTNTDESAKSAEYDRYRALDAQILAEALRAGWPALANQIYVGNGDAKLALTLIDISVETGLEESQARQTKIKFNAGPIRRDQSLVLSWAPALGPLIVRQAAPAAQAQDSPSASPPLYAAYLTAGEKSDEIALTGVTQISVWDVVQRYLHSGFVHIIPMGVDHILFVLGLFLFSLSGRVLFYQISLFTLAHTLTLALSSLGIIRISAQIVEPLIALSIAYVAIEALWARRRFSVQRGGLIAGFGLLHGLGFASVLADFGLPEAQFLPALISFNIGVEVGQIVIVLPLYLLMRWLRPSAGFYRVFIQIPASIIIAAIGLYWTAERLGWPLF